MVIFVDRFKFVIDSPPIVYPTGLRMVSPVYQGPQAYRFPLRILGYPLFWNTVKLVWLGGPIRTTISTERDNLDQPNPPLRFS